MGNGNVSVALKTQGFWHVVQVWIPAAPAERVVVARWPSEKDSLDRPGALAATAVTGVGAAYPDHPDLPRSAFGRGTIGVTGSPQGRCIGTVAVATWISCVANRKLSLPPPGMRDASFAPHCLQPPTFPPLSKGKKRELMSTDGERGGSAGLLQLLSGSRQGRMLTSHLASVSVKLTNSTFDSAIRQCASMRRCVLDALRNKERPFGLPSELPKTILVANIAGDVVMLYESGYSLLYRIMNVITPPGQRQGVSLGIDTMSAFTTEKSNRTLLFVYCMPPLEEPSAMHWELRSITLDGDKILDGARHFARNFAEPCCGTSTGDTTEPTLLRAETAALKNHVMAVSVDVGSEGTADTSGAVHTDSSSRETVLRNTIAALQADRNRLLAEINTMRDERVQNIEKEKIAARKDVEKEIDAARTAKRLAEKSKVDSGIESGKLQKELTRTKADLKEFKTEKAQMELTHAQEKEGLQRTRALHEKEKRDLRLAKERSEKQFSETIRNLKAELENIKFDNQARIRNMQAESEEFKRKERLNKDMHDKVVACMAGQDAELEVLRSRIEDCEAQLVASREQTQAARAEVESSVTLLAVLKKEVEENESAQKAGEEKATLAVVLQMSSKVIVLQEQLLKEQETNVALKRAVNAAKCAPATQSTRESQTGTSCMVTVGTDTYIDTAQLSKTTQTDPVEDTNEPFNVADASKRAFVAMEQLMAVAQLPPSGYVAQSGVHPPARRYLIKNPAR
jgi:hypothetical protein